MVLLMVEAEEKEQNPLKTSWQSVLTDTFKHVSVMEWGRNFVAREYIIAELLCLGAVHCPKEVPAFIDTGTGMSDFYKLKTAIMRTILKNIHDAEKNEMKLIKAASTQGMSFGDEESGGDVPDV